MDQSEGGEWVVTERLTKGGRPRGGGDKEKEVSKALRRVAS